MGEVGIARNEFLYELRLWEINAIVKGYRKRARTTWEATRWQTFCILCSLGSKITSPQELQRFPWEMEETVISKEDVEDLKELIANINEKHEKD